MNLLLIVFLFIIKNNLDYKFYKLKRNILTKKPLPDSNYYILKLINFQKTYLLSNKKLLKADQMRDKDFTLFQNHNILGRLEINLKNAFSFILSYYYIKGRLSLNNAKMLII